MILRDVAGSPSHDESEPRKNIGLIVPVNAQRGRISILFKEWLLPVCPLNACIAAAPEGEPPISPKTMIEALAGMSSVLSFEETMRQSTINGNKLGTTSLPHMVMACLAADEHSPGKIRMETNIAVYSRIAMTSPEKGYAKGRSDMKKGL